MNDYEILTYGAPVLRKTSEPVTDFDGELQELIDSMVNMTFYDKGTIGLAAPQVGVLKRVFIIDTPSLELPLDKSVIINPEIISLDEHLEDYDEGCLSLPAIYAPVKRPVSVQYRFYDRYGNLVEGEDTSFWARVFQHEFDHLNGVLFIDKVGGIHKMLMKNKLKRLRRS